MKHDDKERRGPDNSYGADGQKRSDYSDDGLRPEYNDESNEIIIGGGRDDIDFDEYAKRLERRASRVQRRPAIEFEEDDHPSRRERKLIARKKRDARAAELSGGDIEVGNGDNSGAAEREPLVIRRIEDAPEPAAAVPKAQYFADSSAPTVSATGDVGVDDVIDVIAEKTSGAAGHAAVAAAGSVITLEEVLEDETDALGEAAEAAGDKAVKVKDAVIDKLDTAAGKLSDAKQAAAGRIDEIKEAVREKAGDIREAVEDKAEDVREAVKDKAEDIKETVEDTAEDIKEAAENKAGDVKEAVREKKKAVKARAGAVSDSVEDAAEKVSAAAGIAAAAAAAKAEEEIDVLDALLGDGDESDDGYDYYGDEEEDVSDVTDDSFLDDYFSEPAEGGEDEEYEEEEEEYEEEYEEEDEEEDGDGGEYAEDEEEYDTESDEYDQDEEEEEDGEEYDESEEYDEDAGQEDYAGDYADDYGYGEDEDFFIPTDSELDANGLPLPVVKPRNLEAVRLARAAAEASNELEDKNAFRKEFLVSASPHIHCGETTRVIMGDVVIALIPALIASVLWFGWRALMLSIVCVVSCVATEFVCRRVMKRRQTIGDLSAVVTGLLLAFCLPPELNPVFAVIGSIVAIAVVKQMFGGIGSNFANPAATARIVMMLSFPAAMTTWSRPFYYYLDAVSEATPLSKLADPAAVLPTYTELLVGYHGGCLGETCSIALLLGGAYLLLRGVISWEIPASFMGTVVIFSLIAGQDPLYQLLSGGVILGALFMATDYVTSPVNRKGRLIFGFGCGLFTMLIRLYGNMPEGVSFAILLMNILTPHIDRLTLSVPFGEERTKA